MRSGVKGVITLPAGLDVWDHELKTAQAFAQHGYTIQFLAVSHGQRVKTADVLINGVVYEIKSPKSNKLSAIERNLKRATKQSSNVVIDSHRMSKIHDSTIQKYLQQKLKQQKRIKEIFFVNRRRQVIDIGKLFK